jgi:hypothetical protein
LGGSLDNYPHKHGTHADQNIFPANSTTHKAFSLDRSGRTAKVNMSMKAVVYQEPFKLKVEDVEKPKIEHPDDVIVKITTTAICGSDLHMYVSTYTESTDLPGRPNLSRERFGIRT